MSNTYSGLEQLESGRVFELFKEISQIPRCSGNEKMISNYLLKFAQNNGLEAMQDEAFNIIIKKAATKGYEKAPTTILQGHMDMVCEKNKDVKHDFNKDPIELLVEDDFVRANGTTLGADNGIGVAFCLAILESDNIPHPPLEVVITTEEETGMKGATKLDKRNLNGKILINLDAEEEGVFIVSCAGGITTKVRLNLAFEEIKSNGCFYKIEVNGLKGGHSGVEINKGRANANKIMGRILDDLENLIDYRISSINGGTKINAIPRDAETIIYIENSKNIDMQSFTSKWKNILKNELKASDPNVNVDIKKVTFDANKVLNKKTTENMVSYLLLVPDSVQTMSMEIENLVESSANLGIVRTASDHILFESSIRSSVKTLKHKIVNTIGRLANLIDAKMTTEGDYPEWQYDPDSKIRKIFEKVYLESYEKKPKITAIHAGLECGIFKEKLGDIDMISFGPNIYDVHTPNERLSVSSTQRTWEFLLKVLKSIN